MLRFHTHAAGRAARPLSLGRAAMVSTIVAVLCAGCVPQPVGTPTATGADGPSPSASSTPTLALSPTAAPSPSAASTASPSGSGYRIVWTKDPAKWPMKGGGTAGDYGASYVDRTADRIVFAVGAGADSEIAAVDAASGKVVWQDFQVVEDGCWGEILGKNVACTGSHQGISMTGFYSLATGRVVGTDEVSVPFQPGNEYRYEYYGLEIAYGVITASYTAKMNAPCPARYTLLRTSDDGKKVRWKTSFLSSASFMSSSPSCTDGDGSPRVSTRLHHGVLASNYRYAVNANTGALLANCPSLARCGNIEWVADKVLMAGRGAKPKAVTFPDGTAGYQIGAGAISVASNRLPPWPLRWNGGAIEAFDPKSGDAVWSTPTSLAAPTSAHPGLGLVEGLYAAYDGRDVVVTDMAGNVAALDARTGGLAWQQTLGLTKGDAIMPDVMDDGAVLIQQLPLPDPDGENFPGPPSSLTALDPASGQVRWTVPGTIAGAVVDHYPVLGSQSKFANLLLDNDDGTLTLIDLKASHR